jgi:predicted phosphodiesterase
LRAVSLRLAVYSDLHLEIAPWQPPAVEADLVILAGDIDNGTRGIAWARRSFSGPVIYIPGNHEFYGHELSGTAEGLASAAREHDVVLLDGSTLQLGNVRLIGCTLWTDYSLASEEGRSKVMEQSRHRNPDFTYIRKGERAFAPEDAVVLCTAQKAWLKERLDEPFEGRTVVITHFAPHRGSIAPAFQGHPANPGFIVPLDDCMGLADLWIHGHTHTAFDYSVGRTRVRCNPRGYPDETSGFDASCVVSLD